MMSELGLNCLFVRRICLVFSTASGIRTPAFMLLLLTLPVCVLEQVAFYYLGMIPSGFYRVLEDRDKNGFYHQLWVSSWWVLAIVLIRSCKSYAAGALYIQWRWNLTEKLHSSYLRNKSYYDINCLSHGIDNPDMRITQDVDKLVDTLHSIVLQLVVFPGVVAYYTYKCWTTMGYLGPLCIYAYFVVAVVCNKLLMSPIVREVFRLEKREGHFRYIHVNLRNSAESAAFCDAEIAEKVNFQETFKLILQSKQVIVKKQLFLNFAVNTCDYVGSILSYIILAIPIFGGVYDNVEHLGSVISQNSFVAMYLVNSFSSMVDLSSQVADLAGYSHRVGELLEFLQESSRVFVTSVGRDDVTEEDGSDNFGDTFSSVGIASEFINTVNKTEDTDSVIEGKLIHLANVTVQNPITDKFLVRNLSLSIDSKTNILIQGPPGAGKSSVLRTIKSLWKPPLGSITTTKSVMFLPQHPYFTRQSLAQQITLPDLVTEDTDMDDILGILNKLKLAEVMEDVQWEDGDIYEEGCFSRFLAKCCNSTDDKSTDQEDTASSPLIRETLVPSNTISLHKIPQKSWYSSLSPGNLQLLAFARVLYHKPNIVIMDEATSALSPSYVKLVYEVLKDMGICYLSVSHNESLTKYHDKILVIAGDGGNWNFKDPL